MVNRTILELQKKVMGFRLGPVQRTPNLREPFHGHSLLSPCTLPALSAGHSLEGVEVIDTSLSWEYKHSFQER